MATTAYKPYNKSPLQMAVEAAFLQGKATGLETPVISAELPTAITENDTAFSLVYSSTSNQTPITLTLADGANSVILVSDITDSGATIVPLAQGITTITLSQAATETLNAANKTVTITVSSVAMPAPFLTPTTWDMDVNYLNDNALNINYREGVTRYSPSSYADHYANTTSVEVFVMSTSATFAGISVLLDGELLQRIEANADRNQDTGVISDTVVSAVVSVPRAGILSFVNGPSVVKNGDTFGNEILGTSITKVIYPVGASFVPKIVRLQDNALVQDGDSLSTGYNDANAERHGWVSQIRWNNKNWNILQMSYGGRSLNTAVNTGNFAFDNAKMESFFAKRKKRKYSIFLATNDIGGITPDAGKEMIRAKIDWFRSLYPDTVINQVYVQTLIYMSNYNQDQCAAWRTSIAELAGYQGTIIIDGLQVVQNTSASGQITDGTHPGPTGQDEWAGSESEILMLNK